ncbi:MAG: rod shape-determining protein MreD [Alphaproteobacteria bacterium]|nr:rod shape-determining protein MreD [Alphaproteobacteria bacterium]
MDAVWQRLDLWLRLAMPFFVSLVMALLSAVAWPLPYLGPVMPPLAFIALFYWAAHRPDLFPVSAAFAIGLLHDIINGLPMGASALLFTGAHQIVLRQRRFFAGHSFSLLWGGFTLAALAMTVAQWTLVCFLRWQIVPLAPVLTQMVLAAIFFPLPCWILYQLQRNVLGNI